MDNKGIAGIEVFPVNAKVYLADGELCGQITGISIRSGPRVTYEVAWYHSGTRHTAWMEENEFTLKTHCDKVSVGFKNGAI